MISFTSRFALTAVVVLVGCGGKTLQGNGRLVDEERSPGEFSKVRVENSLRVVVSTGPSRVEIHLDENLLSHLKVALEGDTVVVGSTSEQDLAPSEGASIELFAPALDEVGSIDSAEVTATLNSSDPSLTSADSSRLHATVSAGTSVRAVASGASRMVIEGTAADQVLKASDSSGIDSRVSSQTADVRSDGTAKISLRVSDSLRASASESSEVTVAGQPPGRTVETSDNARVLFTP